ncbi:MAG: hypothetical protein Kow0068_01950 [Marinilabiliales bacterium]
MKKLTLLISILFFTGLLFTSCGPDKKRAVDYNDNIVIEQINIVNNMQFLFDTFEEYDSLEMEKAYAKLLKSIEEALFKAKNLEPFDNDETFKNHAIDLFSEYKNVTENEYRKMIDILLLPDSLYDDQQIAIWDSLNKAGMEKLNNALEKFNDYQKVFAEKYDISISDSVQ